MKKLFISLFLGCLATLMYAEDTPTITLQSDQVNVERTLEFKVKTDAATISIDWGDGNPVQTTETMNLTDSWYTTAVKGTIKGTIKIYGAEITYFDCSSSVDGQKFTAIDVTNAPELIELYANTNSFSNIDLSQSTNLVKFYCYANPITNLDLSSCKALSFLNCDKIQDTDIDFSACTALKTLKCSNNQITSIDLSKNTALQSLYLLDNALTTIDLSQNSELKALSINNNQLTTLDLSSCAKLTTFFSVNNLLSHIEVNSVAPYYRFNCSNNKFTLATLPTINPKYYFYAPQAPIAISEVIKTGDVVDLSAQNNRQGITSAAQTTTYVWQTEDGTALVAGQDYTEADGVFTFSTTPAQPVHCLMTSDAFPKFSGVNALTTTYANQATITLQSDQVDVERELAFIVKTADTKISIDWGDGNPVETANPIAISNPWGITSKIKGTVKGTGLIKIYGATINHFNCVSTVTGPKYTAIDLTKATELVKLYANSNAFTSLDITNCTKLSKLYCGLNPITNLDLSHNTALTFLNCDNIKDTEIDFSACTALTTLKCNGNQLTNIDLSKNINLTSVYILDNALTNLDVSQNTKLKALSVNNNLLTSIDLSNCPKLTTFFCINNKMTSIKINNTAAYYRFNCANNELTLATLPSISAKYYFYAPQAPLAIAASIKAGESVDLSAQDNLQGVTDAAQTTTYTWQVEDGTALVAGEDYTEVDGVFTFTKAQATPVHCIMASDAFPSFSGVNAFVTTAMNVAAATGITEANTEGLVLTTEGQRLTVTGATVGSLIKVYTVNGEKVATEIASEDATNFTLAAGFYVVVVDTKAYKVSIR